MEDTFENTHDFYLNNKNIFMKKIIKFKLKRETETLDTFYLDLSLFVDHQPKIVNIQFASSILLKIML